MIAAGDLDHSVSFQVRTEGNPDSPADMGNTVIDWQTQFVERAKYKHLRGGETVLAARLAGRHTQLIIVRASTRTRNLDSTWRVIDNNTGEIFNIRDITPTEDDRMWLEILAEKGVAT